MVLLMTAHTFLPIPGEIVTAINGIAFGFWDGLAISWVGAMSSAALAFAMGRMLDRITTPRAGLRKLMQRVDTIVGRGDWTVAVVIRFIPSCPFGVFNFALGRTSLSWLAFLWTTAVGVLPANAAVVAITSGAAGEQAVLLWALTVLAGLTVLGLVFRYRIARRTPAIA